MQKTPPPHLDPQRPRIALRRADQRALLAIAYRGLLRDTRSAGALLHEASRAELLDDDDEGANTVALWSRVLFRDDRSGAHHWVTLVPPERAHPPTARLSALSPVGAALIGLAKGQHIRCPDRRGGEVSLTVVAILPPPHEPGDPS